MKYRCALMMFLYCAPFFCMANIKKSSDLLKQTTAFFGANVHKGFNKHTETAQSYLKTHIFQ